MHSFTQYCGTPVKQVPGIAFMTAALTSLSLNSLNFKNIKNTHCYDSDKPQAFNLKILSCQKTYSYTFTSKSNDSSQAMTVNQLHRFLYVKGLAIQVITEKIMFIRTSVLI